MAPIIEGYDRQASLSPVTGIHQLHQAGLRRKRSIAVGKEEGQQCALTPVITQITGVPPKQHNGITAASGMAVIGSGRWREVGHCRHRPTNTLVHAILQARR
jgi:hypothetical protein